MIFKINLFLTYLTNHELLVVIILLCLRVVSLILLGSLVCRPWRGRLEMIRRWATAQSVAIVSKATTSSSFGILQKIDQTFHKMPLEMACRFRKCMENSFDLKEDNKQIQAYYSCRMMIPKFCINYHKFIRQRTNYRLEYASNLKNWLNTTQNLFDVISFRILFNSISFDSFRYD